MIVLASEVVPLLYSIVNILPKTVQVKWLPAQVALYFTTRINFGLKVP